MIYLGIGDLPVYNFDKIIKTGDLSYMVIGWNERDQIQIPEEAEKTWDDIMNDFAEKTSTNEVEEAYTLACQIGYLKMKQAAIYTLLNNLCEPYKKEIGERLNKWGVPFNVKGSIKKQIPTIERFIRIGAQNIRIKEGKLNSIKPENEDGAESMPILRQKIKIERATGLKIDIRQTVVEEWIEILNEVKELTENKNNQSNG